MMDRESDFQKIYGEYQPRILGYLRRLIGENEAEDLTQEVFAKVSLGLESFRGDSRLSTWIYRIATNTALDKLRSAPFRIIIKKGRSEDAVSEIETLENCNIFGPAHAGTPETVLARKDMNACIRRVIDDLPEDYRTVIVLSEMEELKNREIADIVGITLETVKIRLHRARIRLRKELDRHCTLYRDERNEFVCTPKKKDQE